jgi:hypothetical protein
MNDGGDVTDNVIELPARPVPRTIRRRNADVYDFEPGRQTRAEREREDEILAANDQARRLIREYWATLRAVGFESINDLRQVAGEIRMARISVEETA